MSEERRERLEKCLEIVLDNRRFEIDLLWKRNTAFWLFVAGDGRCCWHCSQRACTANARNGSGHCRISLVFHLVSGQPEQQEMANKLGGKG